MTGNKKNTLTRAEFESLIADGLEIAIEDKELVSDCVTALFNAIATSVADDGVVCVRGFGVFKAAYRKRNLTDDRFIHRKGHHKDRMFSFKPYDHMVKVYE